MARKVKPPTPWKPVAKRYIRAPRTGLPPKVKGKPDTPKGRPRVIPPPRRGGVWE